MDAASPLQVSLLVGQAVDWKLGLRLAVAGNPALWEALVTQAAAVMLSSTGAGTLCLLWFPCQWHVKNTVRTLLQITSVQQRELLASIRTRLTRVIASAARLGKASYFCCLVMPDCSLLGMDIPWEVNPGFRASEAGQAVIDRVRHHDVLEYLWLLNTHSNSGIPGAQQGVVGQCLWGDKVRDGLMIHSAYWRAYYPYCNACHWPCAFRVHRYSIVAILLTKAHS